MVRRRASGKQVEDVTPSTLSEPSAQHLVRVELVHVSWGMGVEGAHKCSQNRTDEAGTKAPR